MAKIDFSRLREYELQLAKLEKESKEIAGHAIYEGAKILADEVKRGIESLPEKTGVTKAGLIDGFGISKIQDDDGFYNVKLGFDGYNANGEPNVMMARIMESGTSKVKKTRFVSKAVKRARGKCERKMAETLDQEIEKIMK